MRARHVLSVMVVVGLCASDVAAQQRATFVMRSGERLSGALVDMGADWTIRVNGEDRRYAIGDVLLIDFVGGGDGLPETEVSQIPPSGQLTIMQGGESFSARLVDVAGNPIQLVFDTGGGERRVNASQVGRLYFGRPPDSLIARSVPPPPPTPPAPGGPPLGNNQRRVVVLANMAWVDTGLDVRQGERLSFRVDGRIQLSSNPDDAAVAAGSTVQRTDPSAPMANVLAGALIGRIQGSTAGVPQGRATGRGVTRRVPPGTPTPTATTPPFGIGSQTGPLTMPAPGRLWLGVNEGTVTDNTGSFTVVITR